MITTVERLREIVQEHTSGWFEEGGIQALLGVIADERRDARREERERCIAWLDKEWLAGQPVGAVLVHGLRALPDEETP